MKSYVAANATDPGYEPVKAQQVVDEMVKRDDSYLNPKGNPLAPALTSFGFLFHLDLSPASALTNLLQTPTVAYPLLGGAACVDADTEILTTGGWKRYSELSTDDITVAVDDTGKAVESRVLAVNVYQGSHEVIEFANSAKFNNFSMVTTPNHDHVIQSYNGRDKKWQAIRKVRADELKKSHFILRTPLAKLERQGVKYGEDMAAMVGWVAAEGWYAPYRGCKAKNDVRLAQSLAHNPQYVDEIRALLERLGGEFKEYVSKKRQMVFFVLRRSLGKRVQEIIPDKVLTPDMLPGMPTNEMEALLDAFQKGDGHFKGDMCAIGQKDGNNTDVLQAMAVMCGMRSTVMKVNKNGVGGVSMGKSGNGHRSHVRPLVQVRRGVDLVWCPTTEHGTWIARRNGATFVSGNSNRPRIMQGSVAGVAAVQVIRPKPHLYLCAQSVQGGQKRPPGAAHVQRPAGQRTGWPPACWACNWRRRSWRPPR
jgi:hypothetical protein